MNPSKAPAPTLTPLAVSIPVAMGYVPLGIVFGFLMVQAGAVWWLPIVTSILVFAGAAQFMVIPMLAAGFSVGAIALATLIVNFRHIFYGISLLHKLPKNWLMRGYLIWALTDENYSVLTTMPEHATPAQMVTVAMLNHGWWVLGTVIGAIIGAQAEIHLKGLDFSLAALFAVLVVEQWRSTRTILPMLIAATVYALALWTFPAQALPAAIAICAVIGLFWHSETT